LSRNPEISVAAFIKKRRSEAFVTWREKGISQLRRANVKTGRRGWTIIKGPLKGHREKVKVP